MPNDIPTIHKVKVVGTSTIDVTWDGGDTDRVELARWIATGGDVLAPLLDPKVFKTAHVGKYGAHIAWGITKT